jgi:hypothetical protein
MEKSVIILSKVSYSKKTHAILAHLRNAQDHESKIARWYF